MTLQEQYDAKRKQYMSNELNHAEFYTWLAEAIGASERNLPVSRETLQASTDAHFNDIALARWDRCDPIIRGMAVRAGMRSWSLSDTVCVLKTIARNSITVAA